MRHAIFPPTYLVFFNESTRTAMETILLFLEGFLFSSFCIGRTVRRNLKIIALSERARLRQKDCGVRRDAQRELHGESMVGSRSVTDTSLHPLKIALARLQGKFTFNKKLKGS